MSGRQLAGIDARLPLHITTGEKAFWGVPGQAYRLGCVEPPPFSLHARPAPRHHSTASHETET